MLIIFEIIINIFYFVFALLIPEKFKYFNNETTRKMAHILCGSWIFIFAFFNENFLVNITIILFMIILMSISYKYCIFKGVERTNQVNSYGTVYFFIALLVLVIIPEISQLDKSIIIIYYLPLIYGDAMAAIMGKKFNWIEYKIFNSIKTISGNIGMLLTSILSIMLYNIIVLNHMYSLGDILLIANIASIIEAVSIKGLDNFTIPIVTMFICEVIL